MKKKRYILIMLILMSILLTTACNPTTGTLTCTMSSYPTDGITLRSTYVAEYKDKIVTNLKTEEQVIADDKDNLETYQEKIEELYQGYQGLDYYENKTSIKGNILTSTTNINYSKVDTDKLIEIDDGNANIIKDGKVNIDDLQQMYKDNGCNCKKRAKN